jgi:hypothetical protein
MANNKQITIQDAAGHLMNINVPDLSTSPIEITMPSVTTTLAAGDVAATETAITTTANLAIGSNNRVTGTSADYTVTLPACSGNAGKFIRIIIDPAFTKVLTVDGNASETINGALTRLMWANESALLRVNDAGTAWEKVGGVTIPMVTSIKLNANQQFNNSTVGYIAWDASHLNNAPAAMQELGSNRIKILRASIYEISSCIFWGNDNATAQIKNMAITGGAAGTTVIMNGYSNSVAANAYFAQQNEIIANCALNDYIKVYGYYTSGTTTKTILGDTDSGGHYNHLKVFEIPNW